MNKLLKKPLILSLLSVLLLTIPWYTEGVWFLSILGGFVPLFFIQKNSKHPLLWAALTFFLWIMATLWWVSIATILALVMVPLVGMIFTFVPWAIFHKLTKKNCSESVKWTLFVTIWICAEAAYTHQDISFPWLTLGNAANPVFAQWYSATGVFGGSLWILICNILIFKLIENFNKSKSPITRSTISRALGSRGIVTGVVILLPILISVSMYIYRGTEISNEIGSAKGVEVSVIQPNIDPYTEKFDRLSTTDQVSLMLTEATKAPTSTDYYILPETAISGGVWHNSANEARAIRLLRGFLKHHNPSAEFVTGASTYRVMDKAEPYDYNSKSIGEIRYMSYNTAIWVDTTLHLDYYHKAKLVCGVETIPYPSIFKALDKTFSINLGGLGGTLGRSAERAVYDSIGTAICYEGIYGEFFTGYIREGAQLMFIISNDGWWGDTQGHKHLLRYSRLRAIETDRWIARSANTGISAIINPRGEVVEKLTWDKRGQLAQKVYKRDTLTPYVVWGDSIARLSLYIMSLLIFYRLGQHYRKKIVSL